MIDRRALKVASMLLVIFVAGGFCGWWIGKSGSESEEPLPRSGRRSPEAHKEFMLNEFQRELNLTLEQSTNTDRLFTLWMHDVQRVNQENLRARRAVFDKYTPLVRTNLTAPQQKKFDQITEQMDRRWRRAFQNATK